MYENTSSVAASSSGIQEKSARELLSEYRHTNNALALGFVSLDLVAYSGSMIVGTLTHSFFGKLVCGVVCGVFTARLFVLAHDACHQSLTSNRDLNRWLGRVSFLPSFTPFSAWELAHNSVHHVFSNWSQKDYVWAPFSKPRFDCLSAVRRALERLYRHPLGHGFYYLVEIWWKRLYFPNKQYVADRRRYTTDSVIVTAFFAIQIVLLIWVAKTTGQRIAIQLLIMAFIPFAVWNGLMGFTIYLHHTHPDVAWFLDRDEWKSSEAQLKGTVHVEFAVPFDTIFHHIYKHTAHHLDVGIPFYRLPDAQRAIEARFPQHVKVEQLTWSRFLKTTRTCKLYDYENHAWLDFKGQVMARTGQASRAASTQ
jgi:acyl-lipid omega-6 desaturase (Delta-12 desaturase)